ncbi:hydrogenase 4 subunit F [Acidiferrobacter sp.]|uniref:hydrogenase 4 subunit F n=1 Tax=Acidiferrobacter sp. TaxID=1872107 RepID=UPI002611AF40|nr:hydrogenase 4 subunit F [Acidiferrobacter sp.]
MSDVALAWMVLIPLAGAALLGALGSRQSGFSANVAVSLATLAGASFMTVRVVQDGSFSSLHHELFVDPLSVFLIDLVAFVSFTTSLFSRSYMRAEVRLGHLDPARLGTYHAMYQVFIFAMLLALTCNNIGVLWIAMEGATLSTALLISLYRTPASLGAAWKYFILCGVGIALALLGTIMVYFAAHSVLGGHRALLWTDLYSVKGRLDPAIMAIAFVFLIVGYGTKVGLVPLHAWLPDAHAEGPTPISAVLSGLLLSVALYAIVRFKALAEGALRTNWPGHLMIGFGLASVLIGAFSLSSQRDIKRLFAYSSVEHMGLATFAFGLGGPLATFAALLHMTAHALTKSSVFFTSGAVAQTAGTKDMDGITGLVDRDPALGWTLMASSLAIVGTPPFGIFASEFLILIAALHKAPWSVPLLLLALGVAFAVIVRRTQAMVFGAPGASQAPTPRTLFAPFAHLVLIVILGLAIPHLLAAWYTQAARLVGP